MRRCRWCRVRVLCRRFRRKWERCLKKHKSGSRNCPAGRFSPVKVSVQLPRFLPLFAGITLARSKLLDRRLFTHERHASSQIANIARRHPHRVSRSWFTTYSPDNALDRPFVRGIEMMDDQAKSKALCCGRLYSRFYRASKRDGLVSRVRKTALISSW